MKRAIVAAAVIGFLTCVNACKDHTDLPSGFKYVPPPTPVNLQVEGGEEIATITWSYPEGSFDLLSEFRVYMSFNNMVELIGTTTDTSYVDSFLVPNLYYCYEISAVDTTGFEGRRTAMECAFVTSAD